MEQMTLTKAVSKVIDEMATGVQFHGRDLHREVTRVYPEARTKYTDTVLRVARKVRRSSFKCVNMSTSLYEKVGS